MPEEEKPSVTPSPAPPAQPPAADNDARWGYDLYPERRGASTRGPGGLSSWFFSSDRHGYDRMKCERNVYQCARNSPLVRLMMGALRASGCPIDLRRHIACERCDGTVSGGYDPRLNQVVVCQNVARKREVVQAVLAHEMLHMFDYCTHKLDFTNLEHLACTEIRAANLTHCSYLSACSQGDAGLFNVKGRHAECVKTKAIFSMMAVRTITREQAAAIVERVFPKCYADLEPVGRRIRRNSGDMQKAYFEGTMYGYEL